MIIWLDRGFKEQSLSQAKMIATVMGRLMPSMTELRKWKDALRRDRVLALHHLPKSPLLSLKFADIIADRQVAAERIAEFLAPVHPDMNTKAMAKHFDQDAQGARPEGHMGDDRDWHPGSAQRRSTQGRTASGVGSPMYNNRSNIP